MIQKWLFSLFSNSNFQTLQTKQKTIEELALSGKRDERLERMEFPLDALMALEEMWGERILEGYAAPGVQSKVMNEALERFGFEDL